VPVHAPAPGAADRTISQRRGTPSHRLSFRHAHAAAGLLDFSRGLGLVLGPVAVGAAIEALHGQFSSTHGYAAMWPVIGLPVLASLFLLRTLKPHHEAAYATHYPVLRRLGRSSVGAANTSIARIRPRSSGSSSRM
jgi:hypothetical protein